MKLEELQVKNPQIPLFSIDDRAFSEYGRRISGMDVSAIISASKEKKLPPEGTVYETSTPEFENLAIIEQISKECFGELQIQVGYCYGFNNYLNGWEWHTSSEVNIAVTDLVLILGKRSDLQSGRIDASTAKAFFLKKGDAIEVYATSLHFCPCQLNDSGFGCIVALPVGTNIPLDEKAKDSLLFRKNKWIVAHVENEGLINRGVVPGIVGPNYKIEY